MEVIGYVLGGVLVSLCAWYKWRDKGATQLTRTRSRESMTPEGELERHPK